MLEYFQMLLDFEKSIMKFHGCLLVSPLFLIYPIGGLFFIHFPPFSYIFLLLSLCLVFFLSLSSLFCLVLFHTYDVFLFFFISIFFHISINFKILRCCELCENYVIPVKTSKISILFIFYFFRCFFQIFLCRCPCLNIILILSLNIYICPCLIVILIISS